jgi:hypothetical protein
MDPIHPYERLPLFGTGLALAIWLIAAHALMLAKPEPFQDFLKKFARNHTLGQILLGIGMAWFWLLVAPDDMGRLSSLTMELGEFDGAKSTLRVLTPIALILVSISVKDFLSVRALGLLGLMVAAPLLSAAFLKDPTSRLLIPVFCYVLITVSLFWVSMPYLFRDWVNWATASASRWRALALGGIAYGVAVLACALLFWRDC